MSWFKKLPPMQRIQRLSLFFGFLVVAGILIVTLGVLSTIKITPYSIYRNKNLGFEIKFPAYWKAATPKGGGVVVFLSPKQNEIDQLQENLNITIKDMPEPMTNEHISTLITNQVSRTFDGHIDVAESFPISLGGKPGYRFTFFGTGEGGEIAIQYVTAWTMVGTRLYIITFTGSKADYPLFEKKINTMINSFQFLSPETH